MEMTVLSKAAGVLQCMMSVFLIVRSVRRLPFRRSMASVFFTFALVSLLMSSLYWLAYDLLRGDARMPFAANEFGEIAAFLLLASTLGAVFRGRFVEARAETVLAGLFAACSAVLWIAWSGEWLEDILVGLAFGYYLCACVRALKQTGALSRAEWIVLGTLAGFLLLLQCATFVLPADRKTAADLTAYCVMFAALAFLLRKLADCLFHRRGAERLLALSFSVFGWAASTMYMSTGIWYMIALLCSILILPLMLLSLRREEAPHDLR